MSSVKIGTMSDADAQHLTAWVIGRGLDGASETELLDGVCGECRRVGLPVTRAMALVDTLHPVYEGRVFRWRSDGVEENAVIEYGSSSSGPMADTWRRSVMYHLWTTGTEELRRRFWRGEPADFVNVDTLRDEGETDFIAFSKRFAREGVIGELDAVYVQWTTREPKGFTDEHVAALRLLVPSLALAIKCASLARIAGTLVEVYLGRDAGQRVLQGRIARGVADRISAALWFSDLRGYTTITDTAAPDQIIPLLNDYAGAVIGAIHGAGGEVLKLIGDGTLAIFRADEPAEACRAALRAEAGLRGAVAAVNARRALEQRPVTSVYLGLHIGEVFYGNIGSDDRLDFTVVGPAVNEVSRIASLCRSVDRSVVLSSAFADATPEPERTNLVSVGRYALRGVGRAQELFTLDPAML
jgi:adenylate cyclase